MTSPRSTSVPKWQVAADDGGHLTSDAIEAWARVLLAIADCDSQPHLKCLPNSPPKRQRRRSAAACPASRAG